MRIRALSTEDWPIVSLIYLEGIKTGNATFERAVPSWDDWDKSHLKDCRIVVENGGQLLGWAALSPVSGRCIYQGVAEVSVYVGQSYRGKGLGQKLLEYLVKESEEKGVWTLQAGIFPENQASIAIHEKCGFRIVGVREKIGKMDENWRDVVLMERRSKIAGI